GMLHHRALEWLKNHTALFQIFGNDVALDELIIRENHPASVTIEAARILQNIFAIIFGKRTADLIWRQVEQADIAESPGLIFPCRVRQRFELLPRRALLIAEPIGKFP